MSHNMSPHVATNIVRVVASFAAPWVKISEMNPMRSSITLVNGSSTHNVCICLGTPGGDPTAYPGIILTPGGSVTFDESNPWCGEIYGADASGAGVSTVCGVEITRKSDIGGF